MSDFSNIRAALEQQLTTVVGIPGATQRAWENVKFTPTTGAPWVRMTLQPGESRAAIRGDAPVLEFIGMFQVDIFLPEGTGPNAADTLADAVRAKFGPGLDLTFNSVTTRISYSERGVGDLDPPWYKVPIFIAWFSFI